MLKLTTENKYSITCVERPPLMPSEGGLTLQVALHKRELVL